MKTPHVRVGKSTNAAAEESIFTQRTLQEIHREIQEVYAADRRPWVIGYSGGKDSTTCLQLIWSAISQLPAESRQKPIYVISSDTLVETPVVVGHIENTLTQIETAARAQNLPFHTHRIYPEIEDTFWVNLIGRGYPAPQNTFRWCTDRLKIKPADKFIEEKVSEHGECVLVLGVRRQESMTRAQVMSLLKIKGSLLSRHSKFAQVLVYTPIEDWSTNDVWTFLLQTACPWGGSNRDLAAMYQSASGECPLVVDTNTPSCGGSRFGCWTCTVVEKDKSMESMIDSGEDWMLPLLEFRDFLAKTHDPEVKREVREHKRRDGRVKMKTDGSGKIVRGPYKFEFCKQMLRRLLEVQKQVQTHGPDPTLELIRMPELEAIRRLWRMERGDWEDSLPKIYEEVTGHKVAWIQDDFGSFSAREAQVLNEACREVGVPTGMVMKLLEAERQRQGMSRRHAIYSQIDRILKEDWRTEEEVLATTNDTLLEESAVIEEVDEE